MSETGQIDPDDDLPATAAPWEEALREQFQAYLLRNADGESRPPESVARCLSRLTNRRGALERLATLAFLLDPGAETERWVTETLPGYLRRVRPRTLREVVEYRGSPRGRVDWPRTFTSRMRTRDTCQFIAWSRRRDFETPALIVTRWLLDRVSAGIADLVAGQYEDRDGWVGRAAGLWTHAHRASAHAVLRDVPVRTPTSEERTACAHHPDAAVQHAARLAGVYRRLHPLPDLRALSESVARFSLVPLDVNTRFELFVVLRVIDALGRLLPAAERTDALIAPGRGAIVEWTTGEERVELFYDQAAESGRHADLMRHYFGRAQAVRPDLRLVMRRGVEHRELLLDAKNSTRRSYMAESELKMRGYIADRPHAFLSSGPKVVLVCPVSGLGAVRAGDEVVFMGPDACGVGGTLDGVLKAWLT